MTLPVDNDYDVTINTFIKEINDIANIAVFQNDVRLFVHIINSIAGQFPDYGLVCMLGAKILTPQSKEIPEKMYGFRVHMGKVVLGYPTSESSVVIIKRGRSTSVTTNRRSKGSLAQHVTTKLVSVIHSIVLMEKRDIRVYGRYDTNVSQTVALKLEKILMEIS